MELTLSQIQPPVKPSLNFLNVNTLVLTFDILPTMIFVIIFDIQNLDAALMLV